MSDVSLPLATYRLQLHCAFTLTDAVAIVPYLHELGITDCYISPIGKAMPGSKHGYDTIDFGVLNPDLGTEEEFNAFVAAVQAYGMGLLMDIVSNHMSIEKSLNYWWRDVLENGPSARYAGVFDIDWHPIKRELDNKVLLPILGNQYGIVLENHDMAVSFEEGEFQLNYGEHRLPLTPKSWSRMLAARLDVLAGQAGDSDPSVMELQSILMALRNLPGSEECNQERVIERYREVEIIRKRLVALVTTSPLVAGHLQDNVAQLNGIKGQPHSFDGLDELLDEQAYRLAAWNVAAEEINYRRFFDINELAAIRMENPKVFEDAHRMLFRIMRQGGVTGVRIDHVDGLYNPGQYLQRLQEAAGREDGGNLKDRPLFIVVEKILGKDESLPDSWPVQGTTGYDFINLVNGLFVQSANERAFTELYG
ncbi:MAG: malto-oligosyltrehalose synthase, partial [Nitrospirae bacterium]|nr:malto-oligosyltrehalose synthase [Nitrospirota bacterium]